MSLAFDLNMKTNVALKYEIDQHSSNVESLMYLAFKSEHDVSLTDSALSCYVADPTKARMTPLDTLLVLSAFSICLMSITVLTYV